MEEKDRGLRQRRVRRRKNELIIKCVICLLILVIVFLGVVLVKDALIPGIKGENKGTPGRRAKIVQQKFEKEEAAKAAAEDGQAAAEAEM